MNYFSNLFKLSGLIVASLLLSACHMNRSTKATEVANAGAAHIGSFVWHDLITDDINKAQDFYGQLFGWEFVNTSRPNGADYTLIKNHGHYIAGMLQLDDPADGGDYSRWLGYISVSDIDTALSTVGGRKGSIVVPNQAIAGIGQAAAIVDPQGAVVGLIASDLEKPVTPDSASTGHIVWNELLTSDPLQAATFYQALSGINIETIERRGGEVRLLKSAGEKRAGVIQNPFDSGAPVWLSYFSVDDPAAAANKAVSLGGNILLAPRMDVREGTLALIADPTGALLVLEQAGTTNKIGVNQ